MRHPDEPCTLDADEVADFLERHRSPQRADFVRVLGRLCREANLREQRLVEDLNRAVERLWHYEGKPDRSIRDPQADD